MLPLTALPYVSITTFSQQWQQLRQRYWSGDSGSYHRAVWASFDAATAPLRGALPVLEKPIGFMKRWFAAAHPGGAAAAGGGGARQQ